MEKYGFIYLWFDKKHRKFYIGRHWGTIDDGYICSSNNMRMNYKHRPNDFKRRIVKIVTTCQEDLVTEEQRWLDMIKKEELGKRYYNVTTKSTVPSMHGRKHSAETREKMSQSALGRPKSESHKEKIRQTNLGKKQSEETKKKRAESLKGHDRYKDPVFRAKMSHAAKNRSLETRKKISENSKRLHKEGRIGRKKNHK
jgi:hypothetical protein